MINKVQSAKEKNKFFGLAEFAVLIIWGKNDNISNGNTT